MQRHQNQGMLHGRSSFRIQRKIHNHLDCSTTAPRSSFSAEGKGTRMMAITRRAITLEIAANGADM